MEGMEFGMSDAHTAWAGAVRSLPVTAWKLLSEAVEKEPVTGKDGQLPCNHLVAAALIGPFLEHTTITNM